MCTVVITVRGPHKFLPIGRKHWECVEITIRSYLFDACSIKVYHKQVKVVSFCRLVVARKNDLFAIGSKKRRPVGFA